MFRCMLKAAWVLLLTPLCALAFESVDVLTPASGGIYPAYPSDPLRPYDLWAQFGMMYDTNILRRTTGDNSELLTRLGLGGRMDQKIVGRPSVHLEGRLDSYIYNKKSELDNIGYGGVAERRHENRNHLTGAAGASPRQ